VEKCHFITECSITIPMSVPNDVKRSFHAWWKSSIDLARGTNFLLVYIQRQGKRALLPNPADFIVGKTTSVVPAISYDSNFVFL